MSKIVNVYIFYDLDGLPRNPTNNLKFKNYLFRATNIVKNSDKDKYVYSGYGMKFDSAGSWSFDNDFAPNAIIFGDVNSSSSHSDNRQTKFLILGEGPTYVIVLMKALDYQKKSLELISLKQAQNVVWVYIIMVIIVICFLMEKKP